MNQLRTTLQSAPRVLLYERQALLRQGLRCLLEQLGFRVVAEAADSDECLVRARHTRPDVVVVDEGCAADVAELLKTYPTKVVVLVGDVGQAVPSHHGYAVSKNADATTLSSVIRRVCGETAWLGCPSPKDTPNLKPRDWEVLRLLATGQTNKEIGSALGVTEKTVRQRLTEIFAAIAVRNRTEAALYTLNYRDAPELPERSAA